MTRTGRAAARVARNAGSEVIEGTRFAVSALKIDRRRRRQTEATIATLRERYRSPVFGQVYVWDLVERLAQCIDPTDCRLLGGSQQLHVLQMLEQMERERVSDPYLLVAAAIHDIGKLLLLVGEDPANVVGPSSPISTPPSGAGLDHMVLQWGHAELAFARFEAHVPDHVAWLIRYHNITRQECKDVMNGRDRDYAHRYLEVFRRYDRGSKSAVRVPRARIDRYRDLVEKHFPDPIPF